ncbi:MAG TPA: DUF58 domain-containing protein [Anaerolineae bacterium]|nr:DUF58 domain-containing protein [Anaerolineae bacterium]
MKRLRRIGRFDRADGVTTIRVRRRAWIVALGLMVAWLILQPAALALTGVVTLGSLILIGFLWARAMALNVTGQRTLRYAAVQVGDELEESIALHNRSRLPVLWAEFIDRSNIPGYTITGVSVVGGRGVDRWRAHTTCRQRGVFTLGPWELGMGDPFGIFDIRQVYAQPTELLVYPALAPLPPHILPRSKQLGDLHPFRQPLSAETINVTTIRPYSTGDPLHRVHWRTTARQNKLFVKVFEPEASASIWLIPDLDAAAHVGAGTESSFETMIVLLASLASYLLNERLAVGLLAGANAAPAILPQYGQAHLWTILRALAPLQADSAQALTEILPPARSLISARDSIVVVTPSLNPDWSAALKQLRGSPHTGGVEAILLDPASFGGAEGADTCATLLAQRGIAAQVVRREEVRPISGAYGEIRRWEFKTLGTGRVVVRQTPRPAPSLASPFR